MLRVSNLFNPNSNHDNQMKYEQQATRPEFFNSKSDKVYVSATSGSSPFNEWYEFDNRTEAIDHISDMFRSQSFIDHYQLAQNEIYNEDELHEVLLSQYGEDYDFDEVIEEADLDGLKTASLDEMVIAESRF